MELQLRCFITGPRVAASHLVGYAEHLSRRSVRVRFADMTNTASCLPMAGDHVHVYVELPAQRVSDVRRCLYCIATVIDAPAGPDVEPVITASIEDMQFRDLPVQFTRQSIVAAAPWQARTM